MATSNEVRYVRITALVREHPGLTAQELAELAPPDTPIDWLPVVLRRLTNRGLVTRESATRVGKKSLYTHWPRTP